jgi:hypothetical protein
MWFDSVRGCVAFRGKCDRGHTVILIQAFSLGGRRVVAASKAKV